MALVNFSQDLTSVTRPGHYIAWVKANATSAASTLGETPDDPDKEQWVKVRDFRCY